MIDFLIFSKNRPMQLHALLSSFRENISGDYRLKVLCKYEEKFLKALKEVKDEFQSVIFVDEINFQDQLEESVGDDLQAFLVDDIIVKDKVDLNLLSSVLNQNDHVLCFSLRLGLHLKSCYMTGTSQRIPSGMTQGDLFIWDWRQGEHDWGYPLSVDGHIFRANDLKNWIKNLKFKNPNQFEDSLQLLKSSMSRNSCVCFHRSKIVNIPLNRVQEDYKNRNIGENAEDLLTLWNEGLRFSTNELFDISNDVVHSNIKMNLTKVKHAS